MKPSAALSALLALASSVAGAEPRVALDRFDPAPAGDTLLELPDTRVVGRLRPSAALRLGYAHAPLVLALSRSDGSSESVTVVDHELVAHLQGSLALSKRLLLDLDAPFVLAQGGDAGRLGDNQFGAPSGADFGDLRLGARLALLDPRGGVPGAAFAGSLWVPTGSGRYAGSERVRFSVAVLSGGDFSRFLWRFAAGARERSADPIYAGVFGSEAFAGAGAGVRFGPALVAAELVGATGLDVDTGWFGRNTTHLEALLSARCGFGPISAVVAGGPGLTRGAGTPAYRVILGVDASFELLPEKREPAPGAAAEGGGARGKARLREPDRDHDGVPDARDQCPDVIGDPRGLRPGCPPDADGDGIADADDHCPTVFGVPSADPARHGCPSDRDEDGIPDGSDACPDEKGEKSQDPKQNGCPPSVRVGRGSILISDQVNFATGSDVLAPESSRVLAQVADVMKQHPEIARVAVDGHTDDVGTDKANLGLSRRRAAAVVRWLVAHGVDERRLEARGFGARQPIADRKTPEGRAKNRRVEFQILKRSELGERGWKDGPVE
jgi:OmpA-OmpF porin, OOP family